MQLITTAINSLTKQMLPNNYKTLALYIKDPLQCTVVQKNIKNSCVATLNSLSHRCSSISEKVGFEVSSAFKPLTSACNLCCAVGRNEVGSYHKSISQR